jgi:cytochrome c-type biogenesis protein
LLVFALISSASSSFFINKIVKYKKLINLIAGLIMLVISIYYLFFVFKII